MRRRDPNYTAPNIKTYSAHAPAAQRRFINHTLYQGTTYANTPCNEKKETDERSLVGCGWCSYPATPIHPHSTLKKNLKAKKKDSGNKEAESGLRRKTGHRMRVKPRVRQVQSKQLAHARKKL